MMAFLQVVRCGWKSSSGALYAGGHWLWEGWWSDCWMRV